MRETCLPCPSKVSSCTIATKWTSDVSTSKKFFSLFAQSSETSALMPLNNTFNLSASSFVAFSLTTFGSDSTNFLAWREGRKKSEPHVLVRVVQCRKRWYFLWTTYLDQVHARHQGLDFPDRFSFLCGVNLCQSDVEDCLFFRFLFRCRSGLVATCLSSSCACCGCDSCCWQGNVCNVEF